MSKPIKTRGWEQALVFLLAAFIAVSTAAAAEIVPSVQPGAGGPMAVQQPAEEEVEPVYQSWRHKVVVIPVHGTIIGEPLSEMPKQAMAALDKADKDGADLVVLEIDSPGGEVGICDTMSKKIFETKTPTIALVVHKAVSGGAMLASAAKEIVMTRTARMGDIQPMQASLTGTSGQMDERTAEKIEVDIRTILKVYAEGRGRPPAVFASMVSRDITLYQVTFDNGVTEYLDSHELKLYEENIEKGRENRKITASKIVKPAGQLLELTAGKAVEYGIASEVVNSADEFYASRGIDKDHIVRADVVEGTFELRNLLPSLDDIGLPVWVLVLLGVFLIVGIAGIVTEFHAPGTGIPAAIGIIGFVCFFTTLLMYDRGSPVGVVIFLVGVALLVVEIMVIPGFGVTGILGILGILAGLFLAFTPDWNSEYMRTFMWAEIGSFTLLMLAAVIATAFVIWLIANYGDRLPLLSMLTMRGSIKPGANPNPETMSNENSAESARLKAKSLVGQKGRAESMLRPAGKVRLDSGELIDVVTDGVFIEPGSRVEVKEAVPGRILVMEERSQS